MAKGISEEFEGLYYDNYQKVYKLALGLTGNTNDAEEITQESFFRAYQYYENFRKESSFFTWIYRITLNVANGYLKQRKKMPVQALTEDLGYSLEDVIDEHPSDDPEISMLAKEARYMCLHCLIECLPPEQRKIFCLAITLGLPYKMVGEILECSVSKVKVTLYRAKKRWFGYMENRCSLIKKTNPCNCAQWVRFGLKQGWVTGTYTEINPQLEKHLQAITEVRSLRALRDIYMTLYADKMDETLCDRIRSGITSKEWPTVL